MGSVPDNLAIPPVTLSLANSTPLKTRPCLQRVVKSYGHNPVVEIPTANAPKPLLPNTDQPQVIAPKVIDVEDDPKPPNPPSDKVNSWITDI